MWSRIRHFIEQHQLLKPHGRYIVALSGGADSVALLLILRQLGYHIEAAHCNFHLRGEESQRDEQFVKQLCEQKQVELHLAHFDTRAYAELHKVSIEMAARQLRYHYFEQLRQDLGADDICVAHHRNDSAETMLLNLIRGTGIHGLTGIRPRNGHIVRPLLCISRHEIESYLQSISQPFVTDSTNLVADVVRNKIRLNILPLLREINPSIDQSLQTTTEQMAQAERIYNAYVDSFLPSGKNCNKICISELRKSASPEAILYEWLCQYHFSPATIRQIYEHLDAPSGRLWSSPTHEVLIDRGYIITEPIQPALPMLRIPETGTYIYNKEQLFTISLESKVEVERSPHCACLDADKVQFPLTLRPVQAGDRFIPFGMKGSRLVSDFLTDCKQSLFSRRHQLVVVDYADCIVWLVGLRPDARYCIGPNTQTMLKIAANKES